MSPRKSRCKSGVTFGQPADQPESAILGDDSLEIFAGNDQRTVGCDVQPVEQAPDIGFKRGTRRGVKRFECLDDRTVVATENLDPMPRRLVTEDEVPAFRIDTPVCTEQDVEMRSTPP